MSYTSLHLFCGLGGDALGFRRAGFDVMGGLDANAEACEDFRMLVGAPAHQRDLSSILPDDLIELFGRRAPDVLVMSPPCKGYSRCLPAALARTAKYQALNSLGEYVLMVVLDAWKDDPPSLILLENVPGIASEGRAMLDAMQAQLAHSGYVSRETSHDCGELGGLAQHRRRFLMVARRYEKVPEFLYEPPRRRVRGVGEVLGQLPVPTPGSDAGGPMHSLGKLAALNWLRLALIPAGGDWRDLPEAVAVREMYRGCYGLEDWNGAAHCVRGAHEPRLAPASVADPRLGSRAGRHNGGYGVNCWDHGSHTVVAAHDVRNVWGSVADPRLGEPQWKGCYGVLSGQDPSPTVVASCKMENSTASIADPRLANRREGAEGVKGWGQPSTCVIGNASHHNGPWQVADPRLGYSPRPGQLGVIGEEQPSPTIRGHHRVGQAPAAVADSRLAEPTHYLRAGEPPVLEGPLLDLENKSAIHLVICALDGTWHRPMTTLELAALQGFPTQVDGKWLELAGGAKARWRQRIGNAIPPPTAEEIARSCWRTLEASAQGGLMLCGEPVWVERRAG